MVIMSLEGSPPPALIWVHRVCAWSLNMTGAWRLIRYEVEFFGAERQVGTVDSWYGSEH